MFSAFLDNVTTVLLTVPVTFAVCRELKVPPYPFLFNQIIASNIGGAATLIGDPPNIIIGSAANLAFDQFVVHLTPVVLVVLAVQVLITHLIWGRKLHATAEDRARVMAMDERAAITDWKLLKQALTVLAAVVVAFVVARFIGLLPATIAMVGAAVLLLLDSHGRTSEEQTHHVHGRLSELEWITLFFFIGLFILVAGVERAGLLDILARKLVAATGGEMTTMAFTVLWASAILSAIIDNIPFVATMIPVIKDMAPVFGGAEHLLPL